MELEDRLTQATADQVFTALWGAWLCLFNAPPTKEAIMLLVAHWALETGWGKSVHCWNLGNIKGRADDTTRDHCYYKCGEELRFVDAQTLAKADPAHVSILRMYDRGEVCFASTMFFPKHPACCFRAFQSIEAGAVDYLATLRRNFARAWPFVLKGDPFSFVTALKAQGYFTADLDTYRRNVCSIFSTVSKQLKVDVNSLPVFSGEQLAQTDALVQLTLRELLDDLAAEDLSHASLRQPTP